MIGVEAIGDGVSLVPAVDFIYPDEGDEPSGTWARHATCAIRR